MLALARGPAGFSFSGQKRSQSGAPAENGGAQKSAWPGGWRIPRAQVSRAMGGASGRGENFSAHPWLSRLQVRKTSTITDRRSEAALRAAKRQGAGGDFARWGALRWTRAQKSSSWDEANRGRARRRREKGPGQGPRPHPARWQRGGGYHLLNSGSSPPTMAD